jgi:hypothetical protein
MEASRNYTGIEVESSWKVVVLKQNGDGSSFAQVLDVRKAVKTQVRKKSSRWLMTKHRRQIQLLSLANGWEKRRDLGA